MNFRRIHEQANEPKYMNGKKFLLAIKKELKQPFSFRVYKVYSIKTEDVGHTFMILNSLEKKVLWINSVSEKWQTPEELYFDLLRDFEEEPMFYFKQMIVKS